MKTRCFPIVVSILVLSTAISLADNYTNSIPSGLSLIANQLDHGSNTADVVIPYVDGNNIQIWNGASWDVYAMDSASSTGWIGTDGAEVSLASLPILTPGISFFYGNDSGQFAITFTGTPHVPVLPLSFTRNTLHYLSRQTNGPGSWDNITGLPPEEGALLLRWNGASFQTNLFTGGQWQPANPVVNIGEGVVIWLPPAEPPIITMQPHSQDVPLGSNATFTVVAEGSPPLSYQWRFEGMPLPDGTNATLTLPNIGTNNLGLYDVLVSNSAGSTNSDQARLGERGFCVSPGFDPGFVRVCPGVQFTTPNGRVECYSDWADGKFYCDPVYLVLEQVSGIPLDLDLARWWNNVWEPWVTVPANGSAQVLVPYQVSLSQLGGPDFAFRVRATIPGNAVAGDRAKIKVSFSQATGPYCDLLPSSSELDFLVGGIMLLPPVHTTDCCWDFNLAPRCLQAIPTDLVKIVAQVTSPGGKVQIAMPIGSVQPDYTTATSVTWDSGNTGLIFPPSGLPVSLCFQCGNTASMLVNFKGYNAANQLIDLNETVTVSYPTCKDTTPPMIDVCPPAQTVICQGVANTHCTAPAPNVAGSMFAALGGIAQDNCTPNAQLLITQSPTAGTSMATGDITVTVRDLAGNIATCLVHVTVNWPTLSAAPFNGTVYISWPSPPDPDPYIHYYKLQHADSLAGPWTTVDGATSPYTVAPTAPQKFYRLLLEENP